MSATPEQIAERLEMQAASVESTYGAIAGPTAKEFRAAASLIRAQAERVRVLEEALSAIVRLSEETDELTELSGKEIIGALVNCEKTARAAIAKATGAPQ